MLNYCYIKKTDIDFLMYLMFIEQIDQMYNSTSLWFIYIFFTNTDRLNQESVWPRLCWCSLGSLQSAGYPVTLSTYTAPITTPR